MSDAASIAYNESITVVLRGKLDRAALRRAVRQLVGRCDALRMVIGESGDHQSVAAREIDVACSELRGTDVAEQAAGRVAALGAEPFDLSTGPLVRFQLLDLGDDLNWLVVVAHHVVVDGQSLVTMLRELGPLYETVANNAETDGSVATGYADYLDMMQRPIPPEERAANEAYGLDKLAGTLPRLDLPGSRPRPAVQTHNGARLRRDLGADLAERAAVIATQHGCTKFAVLLAGFRALLYALVKSDDAVIGISASGQTMAGWSNLVGCCVSVLPLRLATDHGDTFRNLLALARDNVVGALEHHRVSLADLVTKLGIPRDPSRAPLIDIHFNYDKVETGISFGALDVAVQTNHFGFVRRDLTWNPIETGDGLSLICDFNTDLFDMSVVGEWMADYTRLLDIATRQPDLTLAGLAEALTAAKAGSLKIVSGSRLQQTRRKTVGSS
jgi:hypothetical protein